MIKPLILALALAWSAGAQAAPGVAPYKAELEDVLTDLAAWLPGAWDSYPQIALGRRLGVPAEGEHEHWHRVIARIDAPQLGNYVFYGELFAEGRDGPIVGGQQILYVASIDERRGVVNIAGRGVADPEKYEHLQDHPELWRQVRQREGKINCDFVWRRAGEHLVGVLEGISPEGRKGGPGTCTYISPNNGAEMMWDAEWVLSPEELWIYDNGYIGTEMWQGRKDRVHSKSYRARPYACIVKRNGKAEAMEFHDRGYSRPVPGSGDLSVQLLRMKYPATSGLRDELHLSLLRTEGKTATTVAETTAAPLADAITLAGAGVSVSCRRKAQFAPMKAAP
jgi:hypothetical protein